MKWFKKICAAISTHKKFSNKIGQNWQSSQQLKWHPSWFGADTFNRKLVKNIKRFQLKYDMPEPTGVVDTETYRRKVTEREGLLIALHEYAKKSKKKGNTIVCNNKDYEIGWDKVITYKEIGGLTLPSTCYKKYKGQRKPNMFVAHWDVCLSSKTCVRILKNREISVHFCIDNDGTIYQLMDCNDIAYHAGNWKVNTKSVGVEISDAYYPKYQDLYKTKGFGPRPMWKNVEVHGKKLKPFLGFYPVQIQAFKALTKALHKAYDIPLVAPMEEGKLQDTVDLRVRKGTFKGVVSHYHITTRKIDCAGFKLDEVLKEIP